MSPRVVAIVAFKDLVLSSFSVGLSSVTSLGCGAPTLSQPVGRNSSAPGAAVAVPSGVVAASSVAVAVLSACLSESSPQPARMSAKHAMRTARSRGTAGKDNAARVSLSPAVRPYDHLLLDLDGCLWLGDEPLPGAADAVVAGPCGGGGEPIPGAADAVVALREAGKSVLFLTNDVRQPPEGFVRKLWRLGFKASPDELLSAGAALQSELAGRSGQGAAYVVGSQALVDHVAEAGYRIVNNTRFATRADIVV